ncbi:hypothetical protein Tco_0882270 [Tanacetum coccineum]
MQIPAWMITDEMKKTEHYQMYAEVFVIDVPLTQTDEEITDEVYELKRREKGKLKLQELTDTPHTTSSSSLPHKKLAKTNRLLSLFKTKPTRFKCYKSFFHELQGRYGYLFAHIRARFMPRKSFDTLANNLHDVMVETLPTMVDKHIREQVMKQVPEQVRNQVLVYVAEGLILERQKAKEETERLIAKVILQERGNIQAQISTQIENAIANVIPSQVDASVRSYMSGHILHVHPAQSQTSSVPDQQYQLYLAMKADPQLQQQDIAIWLALQMKFERNTVLQTVCRTPVVRPRDQDDPHDDDHPEGENSAKRQKSSEYKAYVSGESSSGQVFQEEQAPSTSGNQEQDDDFDFWIESYASNDDEIPTKQVSQDIMKEVSLTIDKAKLRKVADEMLRQRCTSGDEHQYHIDQIKNFLKSDIVWESRKEIIVSPHPQKTTPLVHSCQRDPKAPALSLINQDLLYLKKGNSGPEKIVLSLHKFPAVIFNDDDIEERTSRWNPHAKIFYIRKQKEPGKSKEEIYLNSKIVQVIKTYWELGHEHKFITEIVAKTANDCIVAITEPDYKNLNKNDIEDIYLLIMNGKVPDYADTGSLWSLSIFIRKMTDKVVLIKEKLKAARDRQKSYADKRHKLLEFEVGDRVLLKVSPWKGVMRFRKKGKLALRYVGPFKILERIGLVAYRLRLPEELSSVRDTFHVLNLKKCLADANLHVPLDEIKVDKTLHFVKEPVEIMDREIKKLKRRKIALVKVRLNSKCGPEFTWEHKD